MRYISTYQHFLFALFGVGIVLWHLLLLGYVLTLDMVFGPNVDFSGHAGTLLNTLPLQYLLSFLSLVTSGWIVQKFVLASIFFLLFYLPLSYFKRIFCLERTFGAEYVFALLCAINPFVYERFLAGQWLILFGYALLVPTLWYGVAFVRDVSVKSTLKLCALLLVLGVFSVHFLTIVTLILSVSLLTAFFLHTDKYLFFKNLVILGVILLLGSSYWLVPALTRGATPLPTFSPDHYEVFKTAGDERLGTLGNVLVMHGFWGEREEWIERFVLPKSEHFHFYAGYLALVSLVYAGLLYALKKKKLRAQSIVLVTIFLSAMIFSVGIGEGVLSCFNTWLFDTLPFWKGFRDTQKWSAIIVLFFALFAGYGSAVLLEKVQQTSRRVLLSVLMAIPVLITPMMFFGFAGQLQSVHYPQNWVEVNDYLSSQSDCKALFLPWQQYYALAFNDYLVVGNTASSYFDCEVVSGKNMELGTISSQGGNGEAYDQVENAVISDTLSPEEVAEILKAQGIRFVIYTTDVIGTDPYTYDFLSSSTFQNRLQKEGIYLFEVF